MAIGIPQQFQAISNVLASYNFVDIASGTGFVSFYAGNTVDLKLLSNFTYYSDVVETASATITDAAYTSVLDIDFDVLLNRPLDIKGTAIINVPFRITTNSNGMGYVVAYIRKWDGVTETDIVTNTSRVFAPAAGPAYYTMLSIDMPITTLQHFKIGETLRVTINAFLKVGGGNNVACGIGNDPKARTTGFDSTGAVPSQLTFQCPVRLNL